MAQGKPKSSKIKETHDSKQIQNIIKAPVENYIIITIDYSNSFVLPYKEGIKFIEAFEHAEEFKHISSSNENHIKPLREKSFSFQVIDSSVYVEYKGNYLLDPNGEKPPF